MLELIPLDSIVENSALLEICSLLFSLISITPMNLRVALRYF
jgi:hypothetical protein